MSDFKPRCLQPNPKDFGHSAQGFLIPCCWMDRHDLPTETMNETHEALFSDHLHLSKADSIDEVLFSKEWQDFYKSIEQYETAPPRCQRKCSGHVSKKVEDWER